LTNHFQVAIFTRESLEDSWHNSEGILPFNEQNKKVKSFFKQHEDLRIDALYTSLRPPRRGGF
jgi:hypothetical protein